MDLFIMFVFLTAITLPTVISQKGCNNSVIRAAEVTMTITNKTF